MAAVGELLPFLDLVTDRDSLAKIVVACQV